jgi:hypothetical protein
MSELYKPENPVICGVLEFGACEGFTMHGGRCVSELHTLKFPSIDGLQDLEVFGTYAVVENLGVACREEAILDEVELSEEEFLVKQEVLTMMQSFQKEMGSFAGKLEPPQQPEFVRALTAAMQEAAGRVCFLSTYNTYRSAPAPLCMMNQLIIKLLGV